MPNVCIFRLATYSYPLDESLTGHRCVAVKTLPLNTDVEIECIATL